MKGLISILLLLSMTARSQNLFTDEDLVRAVKRFHPIARAAALEVDQMKAGRVSAHGAFDPEASWSQAQKSLDGVSYYNRSAGELRIPTWLGIDVYAGHEDISGSRTNPEETIGKLSYAGIRLSPLRNLVLDKRRAALRTARLLVNESEWQRRTAVNDLVFDALQAYWNWWRHYHSLKLVDSTLQAAEKRLGMVRTAFLLGDRPAIDTIEALAQVQVFAQQKLETDLELAKSRIELSGYLWKENREPDVLSEDAVPLPDIDPRDSLELLFPQSLLHPELLAYGYKLKRLQIEKTLRFQALLPDVQVKYQPLVKGYDLVGNLGKSLSENNYRFGVAVSVPLRLSEGRGEYRKARLKIEQTEWQRLHKQVQIQNKVSQYLIEWRQTRNLLHAQEAVVRNYRILQNGEEIRFAGGESSLFLLNAREQKTLEMKQKLVEIRAKNAQALVKARWAAGVL